jgi:NNP family nitrate/nitrite transporter-like MFS transporter
MQDYEAADCPMSEPFRAKIGITIFLACLFYQGFITRIIFAPLMPAIETDMGLSHVQAGGLFLMISIGLLLAPLCSGLISSKINHRGTLNVSAWGIGLILIPPSAFLIGGGILPALIGYMGGIYTFAAGITLAGAFMLVGPVLVYFLKLGQYDDQTGC